MSQTSIGRAALVLTTNGSGLRSGLDQETRHVEKWAEGTGRKVGAKFGDAGKAAGSSAGTGLIGALGRVAGPAVIAAAAIGAVTSAADTLQDLGRQGEVAGAMGMTAEQFTGIAGVAKSVGEDTREFIESLVTMGKLGTDAARGTTEASAAFQALGLDAKEFIKLRADEQFFQIFESISKIQDPLQRTRTLMAAFGEDGGKYLLPLLNKTPEQIRQMAGSFAVSNKQMETARSANQALASAGTALSQAWRAIAVALAPVITLLGKGVSAAVSLAQPVLEAYGKYTNWLFGLVRRVWTGIADVIGRVWGRIMARAQPVFDWLNRAWAAVQEVVEWAWEGMLSIVVPVVEQIVGWVEQAIDAVAGWATELLGFTAQWPSFRDVVIEAFRALGTAGAYAWDTLKAGAGALLVALGFVVEKGFAPITRAFRDLVGLTAHLPDGMRPAWVDRLNGALANVDGTVAGLGQRMQDTGKGWISSFGDSATQFNGWLDKMAARQKQRTAEVSQEQAKVAAGAARMLAGAALIKGTAAEVSARLKYEVSGQSDTKRLVDGQQKTNGLLGGILGAAQAIAGKPAGVELVPL